MDDNAINDEMLIKGYLAGNPGGLSIPFTSAINAGFTLI